MSERLAQSIIRWADSREEMIIREVAQSSMDYLVKFKWRKQGDEDECYVNSGKKLIVCANDFEVKSAGELKIVETSRSGNMGEWVNSTRVLNIMTALGYTFVTPPKCLNSESHFFFALRIPRSFALSHLDAM
ncbi:unnamed protein product [Cladocopium goreaui]|uniref:Uncharacterized protein n=1 Tax=Cladocopium goreaui TaxID=2562237 RepID=A0A9P1DP78_9DINO|nr:unnamed protein product [Cladocopium goreaui]|mmetsp:Transcript_5606/g.11838  ORF Transcript_5606/g.11838 Transcript_5606/m.11838 type:complete len:132 (+) Transcript_5606:58-453(+)